MSARTPFSSRTVAWIAGVSVVSFVLAFVLAAIGDDLVDPSSAGPDSFSYSALGHRALIEVFDRGGVPATIRRSPAPPAHDPATALLVLEPRVAGPFDAGAGGPFLVVAPKWAGVPKPLRHGWLDRVWLLDESEVSAALPGAPAIARDDEPLTEPCVLDGTTYDVALSRPQWLEPSDELATIATCGERLLAASTRLDDGWVTIVSDPDLINNHGIAQGDNAALMLALVEMFGAERVVVDETHHGFTRSSGLIAELLRFPMVLVVVQGLLVVGLAVWAGSTPAGKPLPLAASTAGGTSTLIDNAAQLLARGGHTGATLRRYFDMTLRSVARHCFVPVDAGRPELLDRLERIGTSRNVTVRVRTLEHRLTEIERAPGAAGERAVRLACELHRWRQEMIHGTRKNP